MADMRLIDAKQHHLRLSKKTMGDLFPDWKELPKDVQDKLCKLAKEHERELLNAPTVDAVPVIRCKDCTNTCPGNNGLVCTIWGAGTDPDGWCYRGERGSDHGSQSNFD